MHLTVTKDGFIKNLIKANLYWAMIAPIFLAIVLNLIQIQGLFILKDLIFYVSLVLIFFCGKTQNFIFFSLRLTLFILFLFTLTFFYDGFKGWMVYNLRQLIVPILIVCFGYYSNISLDSFYKLVKVYYKASIYILLIGIIFKEFDLWKVIDLSNYFNLKGIPVDSRGLSYMFYEPAFSYTERLASTILDPISLGHILAGAVIMCFYGIGIKGRKRWTYLFVLGIGLILTFSKGAILQVLLALFFFNKNLPIKVRFLFPALCIVLILSIINIEGILIHMIGLHNAIVHMNLFGHGLGLVGNYAKMFADDLTTYEIFKISDTFIGSVLGQIGIIGLFIWLSFFSKYFTQTILTKRTLVGATIIVSQLLVAALSENTLNFTSFIIPGIFGGMMAAKRI